MISSRKAKKKGLNVAQKRACAKLVIVIVTIKYSIVTTFKEYVVINTVTTFSSCKSIISTHSCCNRTDRL